MRISKLVAQHRRAQQSDQARLAGLTRTQAFQRKLEQSQRVLGRFFERTERPWIAVSGGKDSTAVLALVRGLGIDCPVYCANDTLPLRGEVEWPGVDPLATRLLDWTWPWKPEYIRSLEQADGQTWNYLGIGLDFGEKLAGITGWRLLGELSDREALQYAQQIDGVCLGIRAAESRPRRLHLRRRGLIWQAQGQVRCAPIGWWTGDEVVGYLLAQNRLPISPLYSQLHLAPPLDQLRENGWWVPPSQGMVWHSDFRPWLQHHYPDLVDRYDRAERAVWVHCKTSGCLWAVSPALEASLPDMPRYRQYDGGGWLKSVADLSEVRGDRLEEIDWLGAAEQLRG